MISHLPFRISLSRSFGFSGELPPGGFSDAGVYTLTSVHIHFQSLLLTFDFNADLAIHQ